MTRVMMRRLLISALLLTAPGCADAQPSPTSATTATATQCQVVDGRADRRCTPGALNPDVTQATIHQTICVRGWTATVRPPAAYTNQLKRRQMVQYGETGPSLGFEEDHEIPLEAGGSPTDPRNLWPEPGTGPHPASEKDRQENAVHAAICADRITLEEGQNQMLTNWSHP